MEIQCPSCKLIPTIRTNEMQISTTCTCGVTTITDSKEPLYILTVDGDLSGYYDHKYGEGAWDELSTDKRWRIINSVKTALDGYMEDREIAFEVGVENTL